MKKLLALVLTIVCFGTIALSAAGCAEQKMPSFSINEAGELICTLPDGSTQNLGKVRGQDGEDGQNGRDGLDGKDGQNGLDGKDGISLPHVCSDNYYYTNTDGSVTAHCPCELEDHPAHSDRYTHSLAPLNGSQHSILCSGNGNIGTEDHTFQTVSFTDSPIRSPVHTGTPLRKNIHFLTAATLMIGSMTRSNRRIRLPVRAVM